MDTARFSLQDQKSLEVYQNLSSEEAERKQAAWILEDVLLYIVQEQE